MKTENEKDIQIEESTGSARRGLLSRLRVERLDGEEYTREDVHRQCPHCLRALPYIVGHGNSTIIAIFGDSGAGKSHYEFLNHSK